MKCDLLPLPLPGTFLVNLFPVVDARGSFVKTFHQTTFAQYGLETNFMEDYYSRSTQNVIRGMHFQTPPYQHTKIVYCGSGHITDVLLDLRIGSPTFGTYTEIELNSETPQLVYISSGIAHGFITRSAEALVMYRTTSQYMPEHDQGVHWDSFGMNWGCETPTVSARDKAFTPLAEFQSPFKMKNYP